MLPSHHPYINIPWSPSPRLAVGLVFLSLILASPLVHAADRVFLSDGSQVVGTLESLSAKRIEMKTSFAGTIEIDATQVVGITTDHPVTLTRPTGEKLTGVLRYGTLRGQQVGETPVGDVPVAVWEIVAGVDPKVAGPSAGVAAAAPAGPQPDPAAARWELRLELGLNGQSGSTESFAYHGGVTAKRSTTDQRLTLLAHGAYATENGRRSANRLTAGADVERDITERLFGYGELQLDYDEFQNLSLRGTGTVGVGHFFIQREDMEFKGRAGLGYQHESFNDGSNRENGVAELGESFMYKATDGLKFSHDATYYPTVDDANDFRVALESAVEMPLGKSSRWSLRGGVRNQYKSIPAQDAQRLDTIYFLNLVFDVK